MASSIVSSAAKQISKLLVDEAKYLYAVKDKVEKLHDELTWMHCFLHDADTRQSEEEIIRMWISQIRDFAYEAEDIVEDYLHRVSHRRDGLWNTCKWFSSVLCNCNCCAAHGVGSEIDRLQRRISDLSFKMQRYGVKPRRKGDVSRTKNVMESRRTKSQIERGEIVGLLAPTKDLVDKLAADPGSRVVCITGMGGLGKTTLAKMVYADTKAHFSKNQVWIYVSQQFQTRNIFEEILLKLEYVDDWRRKVKDLRDEELPSKVCKVLREKKCLVVLDDVWNEHDWDVLAPAFATLSHSQSKLLLTTRNENLKSRFGNQQLHHHQAEGLGEEDSWELLKKTALSGNLVSGEGSSSGGRGKKNTSWVWNHYKEKPGEDKKKSKKIVCLSCIELGVAKPQEYKYQPGGSVRAYVAHLRKRHNIKEEKPSEEAQGQIVGHTTPGLAIDEEMEAIGRKISKCCNGLPLTLVVLGGVLGTKNTLDEWKTVEKNVDAYLANGTNKDGNLSVFQVLELSYYELPFYLKPCFLHLGNFPEDFEIPTKKLYRMWAIEGIVARAAYASAGEALSVEATAEEYLKELASRCLVQLEKTGKTGNIKSCRLHDLTRDMCQRKSKEEKFLNVVEHGDFQKQSSGNTSASLVDQRLHRLAIYVHKHGESFRELISDLDTKRVRSLLFFPAGRMQRKLEWRQGTLSKVIKLVRVLDFENICMRKLPKEVGDLVHLRYLSLKGTRVSNIPSSIGKLRYLQILDLRVCECIDVILPNVIWKLKRLKHLYLPSSWNVKPSFAHVLIGEAASSLFLEGEKLRLRGLSQLETLENLRLGKYEVEDLVTLTKLSKVSIADYKVTEKECLKSFLKCPNIAADQLRKPLSLTIDGSVLSKEPSILVSDSRLRFDRLEVSGKVSMRLSYGRIFPRDLKQLTLSGCELLEDPMPILEKLPQLVELTLGAKTFTGTRMVCTAMNFPELAVIRLVQLENVQDWEVKQGAMPRLQSLFIYSCRKLEILPVGLPENLKIGCRPCLQGSERYGNCYYKQT